MNTINYYDWQKIYNDLAFTFVDIDAIELNIYIKNYKKIINDIVRIVDIVEDIDYELRSMNLDSDGLSLVFVEK